ncbi:reverse transcriptase domain-containing protein [Tanacetum coccineum]|uniref:Reverse transcriptase domain-containing protein n=1 Tax=Tanacetum coccineum TaxID=301880 RepID=A0ABQ5E4D0_9ASTR
MMNVIVLMIWTTQNEEARELLANEEPDSFLSKGLEKSIDQSDLGCSESANRNENDGSDSKNSIRRIDFGNTSYLVTQGTTKCDDVKSEHLYSASANKIDEKKPELKNLPQHLEYAYLHGDKSFPIIISSEFYWIEGFFQIPIAPEDQEKTTFTCPCGTFAYRLMPFGLWAENLAAYHLSRLENPDLGTFTEEEISDEFPDEHLMILKVELNNDEPWYADYVIYIVGKIVPPNWTPEKRRFLSQVKYYFWDEPYAFKLCSDNVMRRCVAGNEILEILTHCHSGPTVGHHSASITGRKVYESGFYWPSIFKDAKDYVMICDACQRSGNISSRSEMPQNNIQIEVTNIAIKRIPERLVRYNLKNWSEKLDDALWAFRAAYKTPTGCTPFRLVYGKACHQPLRDGAYENTRIYKERIKRWHDSRLRGDKDFKAGDKSVGIKRLVDDLRVTATKLMLLVQKLLLLVLKVNAAGIKVTTAERLQLLEEFMLTEKRSKTYQRKDKDCLKIKITYEIRIVIYRIDF